MLFIPPHSCDFNSIEKVWNLIKSHFRNLVQEKPLESREDFLKMVDQSIKTVTPSMQKRFATANRGFIYNQLLKLEDEAV